MKLKNVDHIKKLIFLFYNKYIYLIQYIIYIYMNFSSAQSYVRPSVQSSVSMNNHISNIEDTFYDVNLQEDIIEQNKEMCIEKIPNFLMSINLITLTINIGGTNVKAMIDTGANCCVFYKKSIDKCKLNYLIDRESNQEVSAAQGIVKTYGKIWYLDIEIQNYSVPCSFNVIDNPEDHNFDIILGINFLAAHRINIDFHTRELIFSPHFRVPFDL